MQFLRNFFILFACCVVQIVYADPIADVYQIDVIIFEHLDGNRFQAEHWPSFVGNIDAKGAVNLDEMKNSAPESIDTLDVLQALDSAGRRNSNQLINDSINLVNNNDFLLNEEVKKLKASKSQRVIKYIGWNQPIAANVRSTPVYFSAGKDKEVEALISIKPLRSVYNVSLDVVYKLQADDRKLSNVEAIRLTRDVKLKKREVYYVDHPVIGMLIMVTPEVLEGTNQ